MGKLSMYSNNQNCLPEIATFSWY